MKVVLININGKLQNINISNIKDVINKNYEITEMFRLNKDQVLLIYTNKKSKIFNSYEFLYGNWCGECFAVKMDNDKNKILNLTIEEFKKFYENFVDLDDDLMDDELTSSDNYSYGSFVIKDDD